MTNLVKRLRSRKAYTPEYDFHGDEIIGNDPDEDCQEAADRIEKLEAALRMIYECCDETGNCSVVRRIVRKTLERKDD